MYKSAPALFLAVLPLSSLPALRPGEELAQVLASARAAAGKAELRAEPLRARGSARYLGAEGDLLLEVLPGGAFRRAVSGKLPETLASDGRGAWQSDWSGLARELALGEREQALIFGALVSGSWLDAESGLEHALAPASDDGEIALELRLAGGLERASLVLDRETFLARRLAFGGVVWHLEDYRAPLGFPFPHRLRGVEAGGSEQVLTVASLERAPELKPAAFALPEGEAWGRLVLDGRLPCVEATFEGDRRGIFRIDTGASGTVQFHAAAVERMDLLAGRETEPMQVGGVGGMRTIRGGELAWFELAGHRRAPLEAGFEPERGPQEISDHVAGTLGGDLLKPFTLVLDVPGSRIAFLPRGE